MNEYEIEWKAKVAAKIIKQLEKRRMEGSYAPNAAQAREEILSMISKGATVYRCGSMTALSMGIWRDLEKLQGIVLIDPNKPGLSSEQIFQIRREGLTADVMIASVNAITLDGRLVNLDGTGNRVAALAFGPKKVILVIGMNKVVSGLDSAISRVKHYAAPVNAIRAGFDAPCVETGLCTNCQSPQRICNVWSIIEGQRMKGRIHVKLIGEKLGY